MRKHKKVISILLATATITTSLFAIPIEAASWMHNNTGWWWQEDNGSYPANQWRSINGKWYWFNSNGYMVTGWINIHGTWYWMDASGAMVTGWKSIGGKWYYFQSNGTMLGQGWHWIGKNCYYMYASGAMAANTWIGKNYVNASGAWVKGMVKEQPRWIKAGERWWYRHADGSYTKGNWEKINGQWYLFDKEGWMLTGWQSVNGSWYYMDSSGKMITGWNVIDFNWYYFYNSGAMASNTWVGNYYLESNGVMATDKWIGDYYVDKSGLWNPNKDSEDIKNAALAWIALDENSKYFYNYPASVEKVYLDTEGNYQFNYTADYTPLCATADLTFSPAYCHIYHNSLPSGYCIEVCSWVFGYTPNYTAVKELDLSKIALKKAELKKDGNYTVSQ